MRDGRVGWKHKLMTTTENKTLSLTNGNYGSCSIMYLSFVGGVTKVAIRSQIWNGKPALQICGSIAKSQQQHSETGQTDLFTFHNIHSIETSCSFSNDSYRFRPTTAQSTAQFVLIRKIPCIFKQAESILSPVNPFITMDDQNWLLNLRWLSSDFHSIHLICFM